MNINIPDSNLEEFVKILYSGVWVMTSQEERAENDAFYDLEQNILKQIEPNAHELVEQVDEDGEVFFDYKESVDEEASAEIDEYDEKTYWNNLINDLVTRDMHKKYSEKELMNLADEELSKIQSELTEKYEAEFEKNGIDNLFIKQK